MPRLLTTDSWESYKEASSDCMYSSQQQGRKVSTYYYDDTRVIALLQAVRQVKMLHLVPACSGLVCFGYDRFQFAQTAT